MTTPLPSTKPPVRDAWGDQAPAGALVDPDVAQAGYVAAGWPLSQQPPARQYWNFVLNYCMNGIRYLCQNGMAAWDASETYPLGALVTCTGFGGAGNFFPFPGAGGYYMLQSLTANNLNHDPVKDIYNNEGLGTYWGIPNYGMGWPYYFNELTNSANFENSQNGFATLFNGLIIQWGVYNVTAGIGEATYAFPKPFAPASAYSLQITGYGGEISANNPYPNIWSGQPLNNSEFIVYNAIPPGVAGAALGGNFQFFAVGH